MLIAERWIIARLRNRRFYSLGEANAAIAECVAEINTRPFKKLDGSRASLSGVPGAARAAAAASPPL